MVVRNLECFNRILLLDTLSKILVKREQVGMLKKWEKFKPCQSR
jgi:hypothetical protein